MNYKKILEEYLENEDNNFHAENYVLLADTFGTEAEQYLAHQNLNYIEHHGHSNDEYRNRCYQEINGYYRRLVKMGEMELTIIH